MSKTITATTFGSLLAPLITNAMSGVADKLNGRNSKEDITGAQVLAYFEEALADSKSSAPTDGKAAVVATCTFKAPRAKKPCGVSSTEEISGAAYCADHAAKVREANGAEPKVEEVAEKKPAAKPVAKGKSKGKAAPAFTDVNKDSDAKTEEKEAASVGDDSGSEAEAKVETKTKPGKKETKTTKEEPKEEKKESKKETKVEKVAQPEEKTAKKTAGKPEPPKNTETAPPKPEEAKSEKKAGAKAAATTASVIKALKAEQIPASSTKKEVDEIIDAAGAAGKKSKPAAKGKAKPKEETSEDASGSESA